MTFGEECSLPNWTETQVPLGEMSLRSSLAGPAVRQAGARGAHGEHLCLWLVPHWGAHGAPASTEADANSQGWTRGLWFRVWRKETEAAEPRRPALILGIAGALQ